MVHKFSLGLDNHVYGIGLKNKPFLILKLYTKSSFADIDSIVGLHNFLEYNAIPVPKIKKIPLTHGVLMSPLLGKHVTRAETKSGHAESVIYSLSKIQSLDYEDIQIQKSEQFSYTHYFDLCKNWDKHDFLKKIYSEIDQGAIGKLPVSLLHGDLAPTNIFFKNDVLTGIMDWDHFSIGPRIQDFSRFLIFYCFRKNYSEFDHVLFSKLLYLYDKQVGLSDIEKGNIINGLRLALIKIMLETYYYTEIVKEVDSGKLANNYQDLSLSSLYGRINAISDM